MEDEQILNYAARDAKHFVDTDFETKDEYSPLVYYLEQHDKGMD